MWTKCMLASVLGSIALAAPTAMRADEVIASNLGPGGSYSLLGGVAVDPFQDVAVPFTVKGRSNVSLTQIDIALTLIRSGFPATTDATVENREFLLGRYLIALYNTERPYSSLGWQTPLAFAVNWHGPSARWGRALSRSGSFAPCTITSDAQITSNQPLTLTSPG